MGGGRSHGAPSLRHFGERCRLVVFRKARHMAHAQYPKEFNSLLADFLLPDIACVASVHASQRSILIESAKAGGGNGGDGDAACPPAEVLETVQEVELKALSGSLGGGMGSRSQEGPAGDESADGFDTGGK